MTVQCVGLGFAVWLNCQLLAAKCYPTLPFIRLQYNSEKDKCTISNSCGTARDEAAPTMFVQEPSRRADPSRGTLVGLPVSRRLCTKKRDTRRNRRVSSVSGSHQRPSFSWAIGYRRSLTSSDIRVSNHQHRASSRSWPYCP